MISDAPQIMYAGAALDNFYFFILLRIVRELRGDEVRLTLLPHLLSTSVLGHYFIWPIIKNMAETAMSYHVMSYLLASNY